MRRRVLLVAAAVTAAAAVVAALAARDAASWDEALERGDAAYQEALRAARWRADATLPGDPVAAALRLEDDLAFREALRLFVLAERTPRGFDNGERRAEARAVASGALAGVATRDDPRLASRAYDLLGVLAATAAEPDDEQALAAFAAAVRADATNVSAKWNLELLLRRLQPVSARGGEAEGSGPRGGRGAGSAEAGGGY